MGGNAQGFDFGDIFSQFGGMGGGRQQQSNGFEFDLGDIFSGMGNSRGQKHQTRYEEDIPKKTEENLDVTQTIEIPFLDFLFDTTHDIKTVYNKHLSLKVKAGTKPGTKFKISGKGRTSNGKTGDMYVIVDAKMPKHIPENIKPMLEALRYQL